MTKAMGGITTNKDLRQARTICAYCNKEFKTQESKTLFDGKFYHLDCFDDLKAKTHDQLPYTKGGD